MNDFSNLTTEELTEKIKVTANVSDTVPHREFISAKNKYKCALHEAQQRDLTKEERIAVAMVIKPISDNLWDTIISRGTKTGSVVYGNTDNPGDIDYICTIPAYAFEQQHCGIQSTASTADYLDATNDFVSVYGNRNGQLINVICSGSEDFTKSWTTTTTLMSMLSTTLELREHISTKWKRVRLFRAIQDVVQTHKKQWRAADKDASLQYNRCKLCGKEATNFTTLAHREYYNVTAVCERCTSTGFEE